MKPTHEDIKLVAGLVTLCQQIRDKASILNFDQIINISIDDVHITNKAFNRLYGDGEYERETYESGEELVQKHSITLGKVKVFALYHRGDEGWVEL